jgi:hypothetical protein
MTIKELEKRVKAIEDLEEIKKLHYNYIFMLSNKQYEEMVDCFAEKAIAQITTPEVLRGKKEIGKHLTEVIAKRGAPKGGQILIQPVITVKGSTAKGSWVMYRLFYDFDAPGGPSLRWTQGRYNCKYIKERGKWKFSSMKYVVLFPEQTELWPKITDSTYIKT